MTKSNTMTLRWGLGVIGLLGVFAGIVLWFVRPAIADHEDRIRTVETCVTTQGVDIKYIKKAVMRIEKKIED